MLNMWVPTLQQIKGARTLHFVASPGITYNNRMDPRISFSNDFADPQQQQGSYREAPVSSEFEFRVPNNGMIPADEIFCKGMLLPLSVNGAEQRKKMVTLREELLQNDEELEELAGSRFSKSSGWWKDALGLKRSHVVPTNTNLPVLDKPTSAKAY